jgi:hypothetical protein
MKRRETAGAAAEPSSGYEMPAGSAPATGSKAEVSTMPSVRCGAGYAGGSMTISGHDGFGVPEDKPNRASPEASASSATADAKHPHRALGTALKRCKDLGCGLQPRDYFHRPKWQRESLAKIAGCSVFKLDGCLNGRLRPDTDNYWLLCDSFKMEFDRPTQADGHKDPDRVARLERLMTERAAAYKAFRREFEAAMERPDGRQKQAKPGDAPAPKPIQTQPGGAPLLAEAAGRVLPASMVGSSAVLKLYIRYDDPDPFCPYEAIVTADIGLSENNALAEGHVVVGLDMNFPSASPPIKLGGSRVEIVMPPELQRTSVLDNKPPYRFGGMSVEPSARTGGKLARYVFRLRAESGGPLQGNLLLIDAPSLMTLRGAVPGQVLHLRVVANTSTDFAETPGAEPLPEDENGRKKAVIKILRRIAAVGRPDPNGDVEMVRTRYVVTEVK